MNKEISKLVPTHAVAKEQGFPSKYPFAFSHVYFTVLQLLVPDYSYLYMRQDILKDCRHSKLQLSRAGCVSSESCHDFNSGPWAFSFPACLPLPQILTHPHPSLIQLAQPPVIAPRASSQLAPGHAIWAQHGLSLHPFGVFLRASKSISLWPQGCWAPYSRDIVCPDHSFIRKASCQVNQLECHY